MNEQTLQIKTQDGTMETFLAMPDGDGPYPPVALFMDIWGMREQLRDIARFVAAQGFACAVPSLYYRFGNTHFNHRHPDGKTKSIFILSDEDREKMLAYGSQLTDEMTVSDTAALIAQLRAVKGVSDGYAGCFRYCMGGRHVVRAAAAMPDIIRAAACYHGTYLATDSPDFPHLDAPRIEGEIYFGYGEKDSFTQPKVISAVRQAFENAPAAYHETVHADTDHGYAKPDRDVYIEQASNRDWNIVFDMFHRAL